MPSAYININDNHTCTHTHAHRTGEMKENRGGVLTGLSLLLLLFLPHSEKIKKKKSAILVFKIFGIKARLSVYCQSDGSYSLLLV